LTLKENEIEAEEMDFDHRLLETHQREDEINLLYNQMKQRKEDFEIEKQ
jgi:hypothetical protein